MQALYTAIFLQGRVIFTELRGEVAQRGAGVLCKPFRSVALPTRSAGCWHSVRAFCNDQLPVAPRGDFLDAEKVTKESHRERVFRLPLSL